MSQLVLNSISPSQIVQCDGCPVKLENGFYSFTYLNHPFIGYGKLGVPYYLEGDGWYKPVYVEWQDHPCYRGKTLYVVVDVVFVQV